MSVASEDGTGSPLEPKAIASGAVEVKTAPQQPHLLMPELIRQALLGTLPCRRALKKDEVRAFSPRHINMVFDHVCGPMTLTEISEKFDMDYSHASEILNHPFAEVLKAALLSQIADNLTDPLERMRAYAHEMIDVKVQIVRNAETPNQLKDKIASDLLDRAGFGSRKTNEGTMQRDEPIPAPIYERFSTALEASQRVAAIPYEKFVQRAGGSSGEGAAQAASAPEAAEPGSQNTTTPKGAGLPSGPHPSPRLVKEKEEAAA